MLGIVKSKGIRKIIIVDDLLTISEACDILKVHPNTLRNWDNQGVLKAKKIGTKGVRRYSKDDLSKFINTSPTTYRPRVLDLFSGCGGLSYGLAKAGFDIVAGVDNWSDCQAPHIMDT